MHAVLKIFPPPKSKEGMFPFGLENRPQVLPLSFHIDNHCSDVKYALIHFLFSNYNALALSPLNFSLRCPK